MDLTPLRERNFGLLWWAGLISLIGTWVLVIALPVYVLKLTGSPAAVAAVVMASLFADVVFGLFAGVYVDRWDRRRVLVAVNFVQALMLLPLLLVDEPGEVWIVVAVAFVAASLTKLTLPAENALLPRLVAPERLTAANSLNALNNNLARLVGPALGGVVVAAFGLGAAAAIDAVTFVIAGTLCALITGQHKAEGEQRHLLSELAEGFRAVAHNRTVRAIFVLLVTTSVGEGMMGTLFAVYVTEAMQGTGREMGLMLSAQAIGGIIGALLATRFAGRFPPVPFIAISFAVFGLIDIAIFNYPRFDTTLWPVLVMFVLVGFPAGMHVGVVWTLFQNHTQDRMRGRAFSALVVGMAVAGMAGAGLAGALGERFSVMDLLTIQGAGCVLGGLLFPVLAGGWSRKDRPVT